MNQDLKINQHDLDLQLHRPNTYKKHSKNLQKIHGKDKNSPLWNGTVARTITDWNNLDNSMFVKAAEAQEPAHYFKRALLRAAKP